MVFQSDRCFQLWQYKVSHKQLLVRSPRTLKIQYNIDIIFWGVGAVDIPTTLNGLTLSDVAAGEGSTADDAPTNRSSALTRFRITSGGRRYSVTAIGSQVFRNHLDIFESSLADFSENDGKRDRGDLLASAP